MTSQQKFEQILDIENAEALQKFAYPFMELMMHYRCAIREVETKLHVLNDEFSMQYNRNPIESIKSRVKSPASIIEKIRRKGLSLDIHSIEGNLNDIAGIRVICSFPEDIYAVADMLKKQDDIIVVKEKDYILHPKENGYRSYHMILDIPIFLSTGKKHMKVEVQLRTIAMDFWASLEHKLRYKKNIANAEEISKELKKCADSISIIDQRMQQIRGMIEPSEDVKELEDAEHIEVMEHTEHIGNAKEIDDTEVIRKIEETAKRKKEINEKSYCV